MQTIPAVFENGVFRPTAPVDLPEGTPVQIHAPTRDALDRTAVQADVPDGLLKVYECLAQSFETGDACAAARHNEHQP